MRSSLVETRPSGELERDAHSLSYPAFQPQRGGISQARASTVKRKSRWNLAPDEGWFVLLALAAAVASVVASIVLGIGGSSILYYSAGAGLLVGFLISRIPSFPQVILHLAACLIGHWFSIWLVSMVAYHVGWLILLGSIRAVITGEFGGLIPSSGSDMVFLFYLSFLCYFLGYFGAWLVYRAHLPWLVALVYCAIMLVNLQYARTDLSLLVVALLGALLLLIGRMQLHRQLTQWRQEGLHTDRTWLSAISRRFVQISALLTVIILPLSLALPMLSQPQTGVNFWNGLDNAWSNITHGQFSPTNPGSVFQSYQPATNFFGDSLSITGNVNLPTGPVLYYTISGTKQGQYLEGFTYDSFDGHTWTSSSGGSAQRFGPNDTLPLDVQGVTGSFSQVTATITVFAPPGGTRPYLFGPPQPETFSVPTTLFSNGVITSWTQQQTLTQGERYQVTSLLSTATPQSLEAIAFPQQDLGTWQSDPNFNTLKEFYLQIPPGLSPVVRQTALQWTQGATNPYDTMNMLVAHLSNQAEFTYSVSNSPVPDTIDAVSWLLKTRRGYCTYYATAMTMMARQLGIPARMVNGFNQGHYDVKSNRWEVDGDNAHSWVQVYFPGQGWINFDPTPGFSSGTAAPAPTQPTGPTPTPVKPQPTPTGTHQQPGKHPTPAAGGPGGDPTATPSAVNATGFLLFSLATLALALVVLAFAIYRYRWAKVYEKLSPVAVLYWRIARLASFAGMSPRQSETPYEYTATLARRFPQARETLWRVTHLFVRERWGRPQHRQQIVATGETRDLDHLWPRLRNTMLRAFLIHDQNQP